jgi:rhomboid protease GluP
MKTTCTESAAVEQGTDHGQAPAVVEELPYPSCQVPAQWTTPAESRRTVDASGPQPRKWKPNVTWIILTLNILVWAADSLIGLAMGLMTGDPARHLLLDLGVKSNELILQGQTWRLVTPIFLHVGILHLAFNAYAMYMIGPQIECFFGPLRFLSIYLLSGIYGVLFSFTFSPAPSAGASGAIFGLIGTQAAFFVHYRNAFGERGRQQLYGTLIVIAFTLVLTFSASGIDIWGHIGGLVIGIVLGWNLIPHYALNKTAQGSTLIDRNRPQRWGVTVACAVAVLILSTWLTISMQAARP